MDWCLPDQCATFVCFTSLSEDANQASCFCAKKTGTFLIFKMGRHKPKDIRSFAEFQKEQELLLPRNTSWTVKEVLSGQEGIDRVVKEVGSEQQITGDTRERLQSQLVLVLVDTE